MSLMHRNKSYTALRRAIADRSYLEIIVRCDVLIWQDQNIEIQVIHVSGMWETVKCMRETSAMISTQFRSLLDHLLINSFHNICQPLVRRLMVSSA